MLSANWKQTFRAMSAAGVKDRQIYLVDAKKQSQNFVQDDPQCKDVSSNPQLSDPFGSDSPEYQAQMLHSDSELDGLEWFRVQS